MNTYIMCVGKIVGGEIDWDVAPLPVDEADLAADARFDAPSECSYFAHLFPDGAELSELEDARQDEEFNRRGGWL